MINEHKARLTISRPQNSQGHDSVQIEVRSAKLKCLLTLDLAMDDFARALTGLAMVPAELTVCPDMPAYDVGIDVSYYKQVAEVLA